MSEVLPSEVVPQPDLPRVFGRYLLLRPLSRGGMGEVFLARSGELSGFEKLCVIKKILPHLAEDREFIRRFIDEAQVAIKLSHANIASVFEVGMAEAEYFLAIEYVEGRDLRRTLSRLHERRERLPIDLSLYIVREVASGLAYAHRRTDAQTGAPLNLVHCDISPPNVLVSFEGEVKIIDFGIAKSALRITATNPRSGFGKLGYMAPEQLVRGGVVDRRTDIYAAGVLLYELLTGERLFQIPENYDYKEIARAVTQGKHPLPSHRDPALYELDAIVVRALAVDQNKRYGTAEELRDDLSVALARTNPTMTGDRLGECLRAVFADELEEERRSVAQANALDISRWASELTDSRTQTVSFALAGAPGPSEQLTALVLGRPAAPPVPPPPPPGEVSLTQLVDRTQESPRTRRRGLVVAGSVAAGSLVLGAALALAFTSGGKEPSADESADPRVAAATPSPSPSPSASPPAPADPVVQPLPDAATVAPAPAPPSPAPPPKKIAKTPPKASPPKNPPPREAKDPPREKEPAGAPSQAEVESKFQAVKREYAEFRKAYGPRLEDDWNDILDTATYGRGEDRYKKLSSKLDRFRQRMAQIRSGG